MDPFENGSVCGIEDKVHMTNFLTRRISTRLPVTRIKLFFARILYLLIRIFLRSNQVTVVRNGIRYQLDLSEGIDLSIFLFGQFQHVIFSNSFYTLPKNAVVFDVGANIGSMTLEFGIRSPKGCVHAFEPADNAYKKLLKNIDLNPDIKPRALPVKTFVSHSTLTAPTLSAVASWKTDRFFSGGHPVHGGCSETTSNAPSITVDRYCSNHDIHRLDLIKIDTEGQELDVIKGAMSSIRRFRPVIIFEAGQYMLNERGISFSDFDVRLGGLGYRFHSLQNGEKIDRYNCDQIIPKLSTIDIIALP
jgi:FkbM family methyltransferase